MRISVVTVTPGDYPEPEQVGGGGKGRHIGPFLTAMPAFPVSPDLRHSHIRFRLKALIILRELFLQVEMKVFILPKLMLTPSNPGQAAKEG